jgi:ABC-type nickel/cobalt efflux system permease component RcnA
MHCAFGAVSIAKGLTAVRQHVEEQIHAPDDSNMLPQHLSMTLSWLVVLTHLMCHCSSAIVADGMY